jgi:hypothetical protein
VSYSRQLPTDTWPQKNAQSGEAQFDLARRDLTKTIIRSLNRIENPGIGLFLGRRKLVGVFASTRCVCVRGQEGKGTLLGVAGRGMVASLVMAEKLACHLVWFTCSVHVVLFMLCGLPCAVFGFSTGEPSHANHVGS